MNTKLTNILLIILLVINVAFIGRWWMMGHHKPHHPQKMAETEATTLMNDRSKGEEYLVKTLGFDTIQQKKLDKVMDTHFNVHDNYIMAYVRNQTNLFNALKDGRDTVYANHCADSLGILKVAMTKELFTNFSNIKSICNAGQQKQFDQLIDNLTKEFMHHHDLSNNSKAHPDSL